MLTWVQATQPQAWETIAKNHGSKADETLLGLKTPLQLAQFKPALAINPDILTRYAAPA